MRRLAASLPLVLAAWAVAAAQDGENPAPPAPGAPAEQPAARRAFDPTEDAWFVRYRGDARIGWTHRTRTLADGVWTTRTDEQDDPAADGAPGELRTTVVAEDGEGAVVRFEASVSKGDSAQTRSGAVKDGKVTVTTLGTTAEVPYPAGALGPVGVLRAIVGDGPKPQTNGAVDAFSTDDPANAVQWKWLLAQPAHMEVLGRPAQVLPLVLNGTAGQRGLIFDAHGRELGGGQGPNEPRWFAVEEWVARSGRDPARILVESLVGVPEPTGWTERPQHVRLRLRSADGRAPEITDDAAQKVTARGEDGSVEVEIRSGDLPAGTPSCKVPCDEEGAVRDFLRPTRWIDSDDPRIAQLSRLVVGKLPDSLPAARAIEQAIRTNFKPKTPGVGFATASEALPSCSGDSSEAAVLTAAVARAAGLPARVVGGIAFFPAMGAKSGFPNGAWGAHLWTEIYVGDGRWHPVDPLRARKPEKVSNIDDLIGMGGFDASHLALVRSALDTDRPFTDVLVPVLETLHGLTIEVLPAADDPK